MKRKLERAKRGEVIVHKRGRKPKRLSEPIALPITPSNNTNNIPKPDISSMELSVAPGNKKNVFLDSPLFPSIQLTPILVNEQVAMSPSFFSPLKGTTPLSTQFVIGQLSPTLDSPAIPSVDFDPNAPAPEFN